MEEPDRPADQQRPEPLSGSRALEIATRTPQKSVLVDHGSARLPGMPINIPPNLPDHAAQAIVRAVEKQHSEPRDAGKREREAQAKRERNAPRPQNNSKDG